MATGISLVSDLNSLYNQIYEESLYTLRETNLMVPLVTQYNGQGYATRNVGIFSQSNVAEVSEGEDFTSPETLAKTSQATFTPKEAMAQFLVTDRMLETDDVDNIAEAARMELGMGIAEKIDQDLIAEFGSFSASKGTAGSALTIAHCAAAMAVLRNNYARGFEQNIVIHPYQWHDIWTELGQPAAERAFLGDTANEAMQQYAVGRFLGATWFTSANITVDSSDDATGAAFVRDALVYDQRSAYRVEMERDASLRATEMNGHVGYAVGRLRSDHGVALLSDATEPA